MALTQDFGLGRSRRLVVTKEVTLGLALAPNVANGSNEFPFTSFSVEHKQERKDRADARTTRSDVTRITGKKTTSWSLEAYALPLTLTSPINGYAQLMKAVMGTQTINAGTSVVYSLSDAQNGLDPLNFQEKLDDAASLRTVLGAVANEFKLSCQGGDECKLSWSGPAKDMGWSGSTTVDAAGALSGGETAVIFTDANAVDVGSNVQVGTSVGSASDGHLVTAYVRSTKTATVTPAIVGAQAAGVAIVPFVRATGTGFGIPAGQPIAGVTGSLTIDAVDCPVVGFELTINNNIKMVDQEAFQVTPRDAIPGFRKVTGEVKILLTKAEAARIGHAKNSSFTVRDLVVNIGGPTGTNRIQIDMDRCEFEFANIEVPEAEEAVITLPFKALASSAGADEVTITWF